MKRLRFSRPLLVFLVLTCSETLAAQQAEAGKREKTIRTFYDRTEAFAGPGKQKGVSGSQEISVAVRAHLTEVGARPFNGGELMLHIVSSHGDGQTLWIEIPLSSSGDAYGESRSCNVDQNGAKTFIFTAGLDEANFVPFARGNDREFHFLVNKYLCRALAAPFQCKGMSGESKEVKLPSDMSNWKVGTYRSVELSSHGTAAAARVSEIDLRGMGKAFDYATCEKIAPSGGVCCVEHRTTQWHCGGKPEGDGWHQVSGDCWHRETGGECEEK